MVQNQLVHPGGTPSKKHHILFHIKLNEKQEIIIGHDPKTVCQIPENSIQADKQLKYSFLKFVQFVFYHVYSRKKFI